MECRMRYQWFLSYLRRLTADYPRIKIPRIEDENYSAIERIPDGFLNLLEHILAIINKNIHHICENEDQVMMLFGMQPAVMMHSETDDHEHFCCSLDYYLCSTEQHR